MAHDIGVCLFDHPVGTLSLVGGRLSFRYRPDWLMEPNPVALSQSLRFGLSPSTTTSAAPSLRAYCPRAICGG